MDIEPSMDFDFKNGRFFTKGGSADNNGAEVEVADRRVQGQSTGNRGGPSEEHTHTHTHTHITTHTLILVISLAMGVFSLLMAINRDQDRGVKGFYLTMSFLFFTTSLVEFYSFTISFLACK
jgi:hypothetical protein